MLSQSVHRTCDEAGIAFATNGCGQSAISMTKKGTALTVLRAAVLIVFLAVPFAALGENPASESISNSAVNSIASLETAGSTNEKGVPSKISEYVAPKVTTREYVLSLALLGFGVCVLVMEFMQFWRQRETVNAQDMLLVYSVTLIIVGTMFLIVVGLSATQIAPALGLYGTIVGYLLGRRSNASETSTPQKE